MKAWLSTNDIDYEERDITESDATMDELTATGFFTTPVLTSGEHVIVGFDKVKLEALLASGQLPLRSHG